MTKVTCGASFGRDTQVLGWIIARRVYEALAPFHDARVASRLLCRRDCCFCCLTTGLRRGFGIAKTVYKKRSASAAVSMRTPLSSSSVASSLPAVPRSHEGICPFVNAPSNSARRDAPSDRKRTRLAVRSSSKGRITRHTAQRGEFHCDNRAHTKLQRTQVRVTPILGARTSLPHSLAARTRPTYLRTKTWDNSPARWHETRLGNS